jgi:hypothetical protein
LFWDIKWVRTFPALLPVEARILNQDREVIPAAIMAGLRAGRAAGEVIPADLSHLANVIQGTDLVVTSIRTMADLSGSPAN